MNVKCELCGYTISNGEGHNLNDMLVCDVCYRKRRPGAPSIPVFVYGTLKRGKHNHRLLDHGGALFVTEAYTADRYPLLVDGLPYLFDRPGEGHRVKGELYVVDNGTFARLDQLEGHPRFYERKKIRLGHADPAAPSSAFAWVYFIKNRDFPQKLSTINTVEEF